jgi:hypothetical protein
MCEATQRTPINKQQKDTHMYILVVAPSIFFGHKNWALNITTKRKNSNCRTQMFMDIK